jgi:hypothetical protein
MSQFNYTLPSGATFVVNGPANATRAQADRIFYEQVAAGALVGYETGQTLTSTATKITTFELSRLDRGTAGVATPSVLGISPGLSTANASSITSSIINGNDTATVISILQDLPIVIGIPSLTNVPLQNPIDQSDIVLAKGDSLGPTTAGPLSSFQVQVLQAQLINLVDQSPDVITRDKGIGQYGFNAYQLEQAGYVKPGTSAKFLTDSPDDFVSVMSSPSVWSGLNGVISLDDLLTDPNIQNSIQADLMQGGYESLSAAGVISNVPTPVATASSGTVYTQSGLQTSSILTLLGGGSFATLLSTPLTELTTLASGVANSINGGLASLTDFNFNNLTAGLTNKITGDVGALIANASKFGAEATALWAKSGISGGLDGITGNLTNFANTSLTGLTNGLQSQLTGALGGLQGQLTGALGGLTGNLNSITTNLTNLVPGSLGNLTSQLDIFGKASQFSLNFANPLSGALGSLSGGLTSSLSGLTGGLTGSLSGLTGGLTSSLTGALSGLSGSLTGALSGLSGSLTSALGSFGGLGAIAGLFGGGGDLVSGTQVAGGFNNTINRTTLDAAFTRVLGSAKIPTTIFAYPSASSILDRLDITQAQNALKELQNQGSQLIDTAQSQVASTFNQLTG